jgi:hypothetical protein
MLTAHAHNTTQSNSELNAQFSTDFIDKGPRYLYCTRPEDITTRTRTAQRLAESISTNINDQNDYLRNIDVESELFGINIYADKCGTYNNYKLQPQRNPEPHIPYLNHQDNYWQMKPCTEQYIAWDPAFTRIAPFIQHPQPHGLDKINAKLAAPTCIKQFENINLMTAGQTRIFHNLTKNEPFPCS